MYETSNFVKTPYSVHRYPLPNLGAVFAFTVNIGMLGNGLA